MSDDTASPIAAPAAIPTPAQPWVFQPSAAQQVEITERKWIERLLKQHDDARAAAPMTTLTAIVDFTVVDDANPDGRIIKMGEEFEISEFDLPRYLGKGLPRLGR